MRWQQCKYLHLFIWDNRTNPIYCEITCILIGIGYNLKYVCLRKFCRFYYLIFIDFDQSSALLAQCKREQNHREKHPQHFPKACSFNTFSFCISLIHRMYLQDEFKLFVHGPSKYIYAFLCYSMSMSSYSKNGQTDK